MGWAFPNGRTESARTEDHSVSGETGRSESLLPDQSRFRLLCLMQISWEEHLSSLLLTSEFISSESSALFRHSSSSSSAFIGFIPFDSTTRAPPTSPSRPSLIFMREHRSDVQPTQVFFGTGSQAFHSGSECVASRPGTSPPRGRRGILPGRPPTSPPNTSWSPISCHGRRRCDAALAPCF